MKYEKPEVALVHSAITEIQNPAGSKTGIVGDGSTTQPPYQVTASPAYAADE